MHCLVDLIMLLPRELTRPQHDSIDFSGVQPGVPGPEVLEGQVSVPGAESQGGALAGLCCGSALICTWARRGVAQRKPENPEAFFTC